MGDEAGADVLTRGQGEHVHRGLGGDLGGLVPQLEEGVDIIVNGEHHPEPVALHQRGQGAGLALIVRQSLEEAVLVNFPNEEWRPNRHWANKRPELEAVCAMRRRGTDTGASVDSTKKSRARRTSRMMYWRLNSLPVTSLRTMMWRLVTTRGRGHRVHRVRGQSHRGWLGEGPGPAQGAEVETRLHQLPVRRKEGERLDFTITRTPGRSAPSFLVSCFV